MSYIINLKDGDEITLREIKDNTYIDEKYEVVRVYENHVLCRKRIIGGYLKRSVCLGDLVRNGYAEERYLQ